MRVNIKSANKTQHVEPRGTSKWQQCRAKLATNISTKRGSKSNNNNINNNINNISDGNHTNHSLTC